jgi:Mrp family chromosome partitioning ATPase
MPGTSEEQLTGANLREDLTQLSEHLASPSAAEQPAQSTASRMHTLASVAECLPPTGDGHFSLLNAACSQEYHEQFRLLRTQLMLHRTRFAREEDFRVVCVMSTEKGEGKSFTASNLAAMLAVAGGQKVLLIDSDTASSPLRMGVPLSEGAGLPYALSAPEDWARAVHRVKDTPLYVMARSASSLSRNSAKLRPGLDLEPLPRLLGVVREHFEWIIVDGAAFASCPEARWLTAVADGTLLVVRESASSFGAVQESLASIPPERLVGVVFNQCKSKPKVRLRVRIKLGPKRSKALPSRSQ